MIVGGVEVEEALKSDALSTHLSTYFGRSRPTIPQQIDPPQHSIYRRFLVPLFARKKVESLRRSCAVLAGELINGFADLKTCDVERQFSAPLRPGLKTGRVAA
jgi:cytochrome P450